MPAGLRARVSRPGDFTRPFSARGQIYICIHIYIYIYISTCVARADARSSATACRACSRSPHVPASQAKKNISCVCVVSECRFIQHYLAEIWRFRYEISLTPKMVLAHRREMRSRCSLNEVQVGNFTERGNKQITPGGVDKCRRIANFQ